MARFTRDGVVRREGDGKYVVMLDGTKQRPTVQSFLDAGWVELIPGTNTPTPETLNDAMARLAANIYSGHKMRADAISGKYPDYTVAQWDKWRSWGEAGDFAKFDNMAGAHSTGLDFWNERILPKIAVLDAVSVQLEAKKNNLLYDLSLCETMEDIAAFEATMNEVWDNEADFGMPTGAIKAIWDKVVNTMFKPW